MIFPGKDEVVAIHRALLEQTGGSPGLRDEGLLDSALLAAANRLHYEGADLATCAATYAYHLTGNHPFMDGNKRIGAAVASHPGESGVAGGYTLCIAPFFDCAGRSG